jgi:hypothetical protein
MHKQSPGDLEKIEAELELLPTLSAKQLDERWRELFGAARPRRLYGPLLIGVLAHRLQEKPSAGLNPRPVAYWDSRADLTWRKWSGDEVRKSA